MAPRRKPSLATVSVLQTLAEGVRHGFDIVDATGFAGGTVYPILSRLERLGWVRSQWEDARIAHRDKRPPRRYYRLTADGRTALADALAVYRRLTERATRAGVRPEPGRAGA